MEKQPGISRQSGLRRLSSTARLALLILCSGGLWLASAPLQAAEISENEFTRLLESARQREYVAVTISLIRPSLAELSDQAAIKAKMQPRVQALLAELNGNALMGGYWEMPVGVIGLHVNTNGLHILRASQHALGFLPDYYQYKTLNKYNDYSGGLEAVEDGLLTARNMDVELVFNVPVEYELDVVTGQAVVTPSIQLYEQLSQVQQTLANKPFAGDITNVVLLNDRAMMRATVNRNAFLGILLSEEVRSIRPTGYVDPGKAVWSPTVLVEAQKQGEVTVQFELHKGRYFAIGAGTSEASRRAMEIAHEHAFAAIFAAVGLSLEQLMRDAGLGAVAIHLGYLSVLLPVEVLNKLYALKDPRIASVSLPTVIDSPNELPDLVSSRSFSTPEEFCFAQTSVRGSYERFILDHHVLVDAADAGKAGDVFVVARFKDQPDTYWLSVGYTWSRYQRGTGRPMPYARFPQLPPLVSVMAFRDPTNIVANVEQGSVWVGYGLRQASGAASDSFEEMLRSNRLKLVWEGQPGQSEQLIDDSQIVYGPPTICLDITGLKQSTPRYRPWGF